MQSQVYWMGCSYFFTGVLHEAYGKTTFFGIQNFSDSSADSISTCAENTSLNSWMNPVTHFFYGPLSKVLRNDGFSFRAVGCTEKMILLFFFDHARQFALFRCKSSSGLDFAIGHDGPTRRPEIVLHWMNPVLLFFLRGPVAES